jgi:hypothetical protein
VVGDIRAPRIAITRGALVRGHVETRGAVGDVARPRAAEAKTASPAQPASPARGPSPRVVAPAAPAPARRAATPASSASLLAGAAPKPAVKAPPPPVVPVLRKGTKGSLKKRVG